MNPSKIPVIVLTGFLASGKTTLMNRLLSDGVKTAVVINEFGNTPVDQDLLAEQNISMTVLSGGCLCCQIKGALAPTLKNLWMAWNGAASKPFERIIIETSGVASPEPILDTLLRESWLSKRYALQHVITTLAIPAAGTQLKRYAEARAQLAWADVLLLTHADLADATQTEVLLKQLQQLAPATPRLMASLEQFDGAALHALAMPAFRRLPGSESLAEHGFRSLSLYLDPTPHWPQLQALLQALLDEYADDVLRIKGVVYPPELNEPLVVQASAGRLYPPLALPLRANQDKRSRLVLIVRGNLQAVAGALLSGLGAGVSENWLRLHG